MKKIHSAFLIFLCSGLLLSCNQDKEANPKEAKKAEAESDTEIRKNYKNGVLISESTYKGDVKHGLTKTYYYPDGELNKRIWYQNGLKEDTAYWHYTSGNIYRATPYVKDQIHGIQQKFYESGKLMARIPWDRGERVPGLEEFNENGTQRDNYPTIQYQYREIPSRKMYVLELKLSSYDNQAEFFLGRLQEGRFVEEACQPIKFSQGIRTIPLYHTTKEGIKTVNVIAIYRTRLHNKKIRVKQIPAPADHLSLSNE